MKCCQQCSTEYNCAALLFIVFIIGLSVYHSLKLGNQNRISHIYMYKRVRPYTHSLSQHGPGDSMEDWVTNFGVQIGFEALTPTKTGF